MDLERLIHAHCPGLHAPLSFQSIPTGKFNTSFFVRSGNQEFVLRIAPAAGETFVFYERNMMRQEPGIHELLLAETTIPVARIIKFDGTHALIDRDFLIMERLPGGPLTEAAGIDQGPVLAEVGESIAQAHRLTNSRYGYIGEHRPMEPQATWLEAFQMMWEKMIDDVSSVGHYDREESKLMRSLLDSRLELFDRDVPASLLHMDIWHQNILAGRSGKLTGLVDWDRALWGDPEIEYAVLDYCGISEPAFWEGYGRRRDLSGDARTRQVFYLLYEIQKYIVIRHGRGRDPRTARAYKRQVMQIVGDHLLP